MNDWELFDPPPQTFPGANVYIAQYMRPRIRGISNTGSLKDWDNMNKWLSPIVGGSAAYVGHICHVWKVPWELYYDGWGVITGYNEGPPARYDIPSLVLNAEENVYYYTIGPEIPFTLHQIWKAFFYEIGGIPPGAIRWGKLWLQTNLAKITHGLTNFHWDGPP